MDMHAASVRIDSRELPRQNRREALVETLGRGFMNLDMAFKTEDDIYCAALWLLPGVCVSAGRCPSMQMQSHDPAREGDFISFAGGFGAKGKISSAGREIINPGDGTSALVRSEDALRAETEPGWTPRALRFDAAMVRAAIPDVDDKMMRCIPPSTSALRLLDAYLPLACSAEVMSDPRLAQAASQHLCDLVILAVGSSRDMNHLASTRGLAAARAATVKDWVRRHATNPGVTLSAVAKVHGLSPRTVQDCFHREGTSFSHFLLAERLDQARRMLATSSLQRETISTIAFAAGFNDLSYFNRSFRQRFGCTPSDVRAQSRAEHIAR